MDLLKDFKRLETVPGDDHFIPFFRKNCGGKLRNFRFIVDDQDQFARSVGFRTAICDGIPGALSPVDSCASPASSGAGAADVAAGPLGLPGLVFSRILDVTRLNSACADCVAISTCWLS